MFWLDTSAGAALQPHTTFGFRAIGIQTVMLCFLPVWQLFECQQDPGF